MCDGDGPVPMAPRTPINQFMSVAAFEGGQGQDPHGSRPSPKVLIGNLSKILVPGVAAMYGRAMLGPELDSRLIQLLIQNARLSNSELSRPARSVPLDHPVADRTAGADRASIQGPIR